MSGFQVVITDPMNDIIEIRTDDATLTFQGKHQIAALSAHIDKAVGLMFGDKARAHSKERD